MSQAVQFGSFFNRPVDDLAAFPLSASTSSYLDYAGLPASVCDAPDELIGGAVSAAEGQGPRALHTELLRTGFAFLNQGAFGSPFVALTAIAEHWRHVQRRQPLLFFDRLLLPLLVLALRAAARHLRCAPERHLVLLFPNATHALNTVLASVSRRRSSGGGGKRVVVIFETTYGSVKKMAAHYFSGEADRVCVVPLALTEVGSWASESDVLRWFEKAVLDEYLPRHQQAEEAVASGAPRPLVLLESISSNSAVRWPYEALAKMAKTRTDGRAIVVVDAAHELGMVPEVNLSERPCAWDFWITNGHKWLGAPSGVGLMVVNRAVPDPFTVEPLVVSHGAQQSLLSATLWHGHTDYAAWLTLPWAFMLWQRYLSGHHAKMVDFANAAESRLCSHWNVRPAFARHLTAPLMRLIPLPKAVSEMYAGKGSALQDELHHKHKIECPVKTFDGALYVRVSVYTYNTIEDVDRLAKAIKGLANSAKM
ncbi:putative L-cysteine desulfhydrase [Diplonema papillatum]|nr:putative L-cysteine desulfhydrase [Diplonema papillatum]